ncbi:hypothetical protein Q3G72_000788 [Acer saccharum]|nr:hypothetical protein Q3G72_000788 [Acer saccharum]
MLRLFSTSPLVRRGQMIHFHGTLRSLEHTQFRMATWLTEVLCPRQAPRAPSPVQRLTSKWSVLAAGWYKVNLDVAVNGGLIRIGFGIIVYDHAGLSHNSSVSYVLRNENSFTHSLAKLSLPSVDDHFWLEIVLPTWRLLSW